MRPSVSTYSYGGAIRKGEQTMDTVIDVAAKQGYEGIEFSLVGIAPGDEAMAYAKRARKRAADAGIKVVGYCVGNDFLRKPFDEALEGVKFNLRVAAELGAPVMRHDVTSGFPADHKGPRSFETALPILADGCRKATEYAKTLGVVTMVENHGYFCQDSARVEALACAVNHENFGLLVDIGNFMCADEAPEQAVARVAPYARHVHAKDFHYKKNGEFLPDKGWFPTRSGHRLRGAVLGHGVVPVAQCLALLKAAGYDGWVSVEFEGIEDSLLGTEWGLASLRRLIAAAGGAS